MPDASAQARLSIQVVQRLGDVDPVAWDALVSPDDPFTTHAFLSALEDSGSACGATGWTPAHVLVRDGKGVLVGAAPTWVKGHSYGEYIFDWGWASACERAGIPYYPKVVSAVPFTPATGRRMLVPPGPRQEAVEAAVVAGFFELVEAARAWSWHALFTTKGEHDRLREHRRVLGRVTHQFHWTDAGYGDFDGWLSTFRAKVRKETRRERRRAADLGVNIRVVPGSAMGDREWQALEGFYRLTCGKKWGEAYLTPAFFEIARERLDHMALGILAESEGRYVAGALAFQRGAHLYGRYWGCAPGFESLHFEICYHRPIALCLENGWTRFEAGAQGAHKLKRGLMPTETYSLHWLRHPGLERAVRQAVVDETRSLRRQLGAMASHGPFRRGEG